MRDKGLAVRTFLRIVCLSVVALAPLALAGRVARQAGQDPETPAGARGGPEPPGGKRGGPPPPDEQEPFKADVRAMLERRQFEALDDMADELNRTKARF